MIYILIFIAMVPWIWAQGRLTIHTPVLMATMLGPVVGVGLAVLLGLGHHSSPIPRPIVFYVGPFLVNPVEIALAVAVGIGPFYLIKKQGIGKKPGLEDL